MKRKKKDYWLILEDEAHLERIGRMRLSGLRITIGILLFLILSCWIGVLLVMTTPLKKLLPGYLQESQRAATEETLLRLDSLRGAYELNEAYLANIMKVFNSDRAPSADSLEVALQANQLTPDSLLGSSRKENDFVKKMREREKYNVSILAPLAAEDITFHPLSDEAVMSEQTRRSLKSKILVPSSSTIGSIADGTIISVSASGPALKILIQHPKGFISRYSGLRKSFVKEGETVYGGQAIGESSPASATPGGAVGLELWHNGSSLVPFEYMHPSLHTKSQSLEE